MALFTASTAKKRIALMHSVSTSTSVAVARRTSLFCLAHRLVGRTAAVAAKAAAPAPSTLALAPTLLAGADAAAGATFVTVFNFLVQCHKILSLTSCSRVAVGATKPGANMVAAAPAATAAVARWERVVGMATWTGSTLEKWSAQKRLRECSKVLTPSEYLLFCSVWAHSPPCPNEHEALNVLLAPQTLNPGRVPTQPCGAATISSDGIRRVSDLGPGACGHRASGFPPHGAQSPKVVASWTLLATCA